MAQKPDSPVLRYLHTLFEDEELIALTDRQLLQRFAKDRCDAAFAALVHRDGAMVLGACRRILKDSTDAEDALQATFLVLARKGSGLGWQDSIANWLYGVASRIALKMKVQRHRTLTLAPAADAAAAAPADEACQRELLELLDVSLRGLPDKYRAPLVLCYLEGKSHHEAAVELKLPVGSVSRHLARGLELLRDRLGQRGLCISPEPLALLLAKGSWRSSVPRSLSELISQLATLLKAGTLAASGAVSGRILALAEGVNRTMIMTHLKLVAAAALAVGIVGIGGAFHGNHQVAQGPAASDAEEFSPLKPGDASVAESNLEPAGQADPPTMPERERKHRLMWSKLAKPVVLDKGLEKMTFWEAKQYFEDRFDVTILTDPRAFALVGVDEPLEVQVKLDKMSGVSLRQVLDMMLAQLDATLLVLQDHFLVTTLDAARPETWIKGDRALVPRVHAELKDVLLDEALRDLSLQTGISVVLDRRKIESMPRVTALLDNVCLDTAVQMLADMSGLRAVALDRSLYVTDVANAKELAGERERLRAGSAPNKTEQKTENKEGGAQNKAKKAPKKPQK